ncbi:unnamed protein product, partial [marine sediment metagenome]
MKVVNNLENLGCVFHTLYGGEPSVYPWLEELVMLLNKEDKCYTFITSGVEKEKWFRLQEVEGIKGISASVDLGCFSGQRYWKSILGEEFLFEMKKRGVKDIVAVTVLDENNIQDDRVCELVEIYTKKGIYVEITLIDEPKNKWYDFARGVGLEIKSMDRFDALMDKLKEMKRD